MTLYSPILRPRAISSSVVVCGSSVQIFASGRTYQIQMFLFSPQRAMDHEELHRPDPLSSDTPHTAFVKYEIQLFLFSRNIEEDTAPSFRFSNSNTPHHGSPRPRPIRQTAHFPTQHLRISNDSLAVIRRTGPPVHAQSAQSPLRKRKTTQPPEDATRGVPAPGRRDKKSSYISPDRAQEKFG